MTEIDLERALARLADEIEPPLVPVSDDVARGRRRMFRHRMTVAGAALGTGAVIVAGGVVLGGATPESAPDPTGRLPDAQRTVEATDPTRTLPDLDDRMANGEVLGQWNDVLAERLDPQRVHLQPYTRQTANEQTGSNGGGLTSLGSRYGWTNPGEEGLGMLAVSVSTSARAAMGPCQTGEVSCTEATGPGGEPARAGTSGSVTTVELTQDDGDVVTLTLDLLFGNNSLVPVSGAEITTDQLLAAAADERLDLPEPEPASSVDPAEFQQALADLAGEDREIIGFPSGGTSLLTGAVFEKQRQVAVLEADAFPASSGYGVPTGCDRQDFLRCEHREVDGMPVFLGWTDEKYFPGVQVVASGPQNLVRLQWERSGDRGAEPDVEALVALVTDPRWQS